MAELCSICYLHPSAGLVDQKPACDQCTRVMAMAADRQRRNRMERSAATRSGRRAVYVCSDEPIGKTNQPAVHTTGCDTCREITRNWLEAVLKPNASPEQQREHQRRVELAKTMDPSALLQEAS